MGECYKMGGSKGWLNHLKNIPDTHKANTHNLNFVSVETVTGDYGAWPPQLLTNILEER